MSDNDNDSVFDEFGNDVATVVKAPKVLMKKFSDIVDQSMLRNLLRRWKICLKSKL
jgi:hypothetical protein